jgi:hypothetical protein
MIVIDLSSKKRLLRATNPPDLVQAQLHDLVYPNSNGEVEDSAKEDAVDDDNENYGQEMNLQQDVNLQEHEAFVRVEGQIEALEQEHEASSLSNLIDAANHMDDQAEAQAEHDQLTPEGNKLGVEWRTRTRNQIVQRTKLRKQRKNLRNPES